MQPRTRIGALLGLLLALAGLSLTWDRPAAGQASGSVKLRTSDGALVTGANPLPVSAVVTGSTTADTELPAAAVPSDAAAAPTAPAVVSHLMALDSTQWKRVRMDGGQNVYVNWRAANGDTISFLAAADDHNITNVNGVPVTARQVLYNQAGGTFDRARNNGTATVLASAARTATTDSADLTNHNGRGVAVDIDVTAIVDTPSVVFHVQAKDPVSGVYVTVLESAAVVGTGHTRLRVYPGIAAVANLAASDILSRTWRVRAVHADADSITYSVGANTLL